MPELPEVEVICQGLRPHIVERSIEAIICSGKQLRTTVDCNAMELALLGQQISSLRRRAKYLLLQVASGARLIIHLGMTGNLGIFPKDTPIKKHDHIRWLLDNDQEIRFNDARRFGAVHLLPAHSAAGLQKQFFAAKQ